jgi:hypothetical protein
MKMLAVLGLAAVVAAGAAGSTGRPFVSVAGGVVSPGDTVIVHVSRAVPGRRLRLYLREYPVTTSRPLAIGTVVPDRRGRARFAFPLPQLAANVYVPTACCSSGNFVNGHGLLSVPAIAPAGFGPLGAAGCSPASPRNQDSTGLLARSEVFGTAVGTQFWALGATVPDGDSAALDGVLGTTKKIIFRMTSGVPANFYAVAPDGSRLPPVWGPDLHAGSNWNRPGYEWGAGFIFTQVGCWQIHAGSPPGQGDVWLLIRS